MNEQQLLIAIGEVDAGCLRRCETYRPAQGWRRFAQRAAVVAMILTAVLMLAYYTVPQVRASVDTNLFHADTRKYIILPPEVTKWEEPVANGYGGVTSSSTLVHSGKGYALTREEYLRLIAGDDPADILADRDIWAAEWKDYDGPQWTPVGGDGEEVTAE